ncbi:MAG TPA: tetratricopeptide repeat protein [Flavipsychrobacter sp.]|nr:tetratricopeptide repeat protein [Flavipsychrobacter sp.]
MKRTIIILAALALSYTVHAQPLDEGIKMYKYERYQTAERILSAFNASNPLANYYYGLSQIGLGDLNGAKTTFTKYPEDMANQAGLARVAFLQNNVLQGNQLVTGVVGKAKKKDWEPLKYAADAITYTNGGDVQQAIAWYKKALTINDNEDTHIALGDAYLKLQGGGGEAMNNYENVTGKDPKNSLAFSRIGALWYAAKNYQLALDNYNKALQADPINPLPYRDLATAYYRVGNYDQAYQDIQKYMQLSDKSSDDETLYIDILYLSKHYKEAIDEAQQQIAKGVKTPGIYGVLGFSQLEIGDSVDALNNSKQYFQLKNPKDIPAGDYVNYAKIFMKMKMSDSADFYFNKAIQIDTAKDKSDIYRQVAEGFRDAQDWDKAAQWYTKLVTEYPNTQPLDYFWQGYCLFVGKHLDDAKKAFDQMATKYPDQPSAVYWGGRVAAAIDSNAKEGIAVPYFTKWLGISDSGYQRKNSDLLIAYEYLAYYYYNKDDKANMEIYLQKIEQIDPTNSFLKQIRDAEKRTSSAAPPKKKK